MNFLNAFFIFMSIFAIFPAVTKSSSIYYTPYKLHKSDYMKNNQNNNDFNHTLALNEMNTIYGTGNKLKDVVYKATCDIICSSQNQINSQNHNSHTQGPYHGNNHIDPNRNCCSGDLENLKCMSEQYCNYLKSFLQGYLIGIILSTYISLIFITMLIIFIIFYCLSLRQAKHFENNKKLKCENVSENGDEEEVAQIEYALTKRQALINGIVAASLVLFTGMIIPIVVLKLISIWKNKSMTRMLGGDFKMISSTKLAASVKVKNERKKKYLIMDDNQSNSNNKKIVSPAGKSEGIVIGESSSNRNEDNIIITSKKLKMKDEDKYNKI